MALKNITEAKAVLGGRSLGIIRALGIGFGIPGIEGREEKASQPGVQGAGFEPADACATRP